MELQEEAEKQLQRRLQQSIEKVVAENADLSSSLAETRQKLESEIRVRENRDAKLLLDTQEVVVGREREKELKNQVGRLRLHRGMGRGMPERRMAGGSFVSQRPAYFLVAI